MKEIVHEMQTGANRIGKAWSLLGWGQVRVIKDKGDIMELLGVPRQEPYDRFCP